MVGRSDRQMDGRATDGRKSRRDGGRMAYGPTDGWTDGRTDRRPDIWIGGRTDGQTDRHT